MPSAAGPEIDVAAPSAEETLRAACYRLLARFLSAPPSAADLAFAARLLGDETAMGQAVDALARVAANRSPSDCEEEYQALFIGVGRGELIPYASYYLTGFLQERPLARLRSDMARIGIARRDDVREPEDHIASVLEMMAGLIDGAFGAPASLGRQKQFFAAHLEPWAAHFFRDLAAARSSVLYAPLAAIGTALIGIEQTAFATVGAENAA